MPLPRALAAVALTLPLAAQEVAGTAIEVQPGDLRAEHFGVAPLEQRVLSPGMNVGDGLSLQVASGAASGMLTSQLTSEDRILTFESRVFCSATTMNSAHGAAMSSSADYLMTLTAALPMHGVITVMVQSQPSGGWPGIGNFSVDIDADGVLDVVGNPYGSPPFITSVELGRSFGPGSLPIRITHGGSISMPAGSIGEYMAYVVVRWYPDTAEVETYGTPCGISLFEQRAPDGRFLFSLWPAPTNNTFILFGQTPQNTAIFLPPFCTQWTDFATYAWWGSNQFVVPNAMLPVGFAMNAQAVTFSSPQATWLSNGLRLVVNP
jgi:hypothetical protein